MNNKPRILGIIPARGDSKGIPNKNIRLLAGKPLIQYTIQSALLSDKLSTILVSTDCEKIINFSKQYPQIKTPFIRPKELATDNTPTIDVIQHAVKYYEKIGEVFDYICLLQPTSPFRNDDLIDKTIDKILKVKTDSLTTIRKVPDKFNPHWTFGMKDNILSVSTGEKHIITRRQDLPDRYYRDGKIYISTVEQIQKGMLLGGDIFGYINENEPDINIDTWEDWALAEKHLTDGFQ
ncbi:cytidylyltransferase domain-containing protein [Dyadobacter sp. NIV53]|uniref:acylneuraminate cytidylyltransferase family protein n=1 Tax=Dyadobacter sp. NIV53 TaxID=2861765 RepID=UPI001C86EA21|nr:acylneuraminate cytidylyltransferase family protein [Dyadobacter sp. NIV53]